MQTVYFNHSKVFRYRDWDVTIAISKYVDSGRPAILLRAADSEHNEKQDVMPGEPIATLSVNLPDQEIPFGCTHIKDWSENEGALDWLVDNGLVSPLNLYSGAGYTLARVVRPTPELYAVAGRL